MLLQTIDQFYEAALLPELWPTACEALAKEVNATTATIFAIDEHGGHHFVCTPNIREGILRFSTDPRRLENPRPARALERFPFTFTRELALLTMEELEQDVVLNEFIRPAGMNWSVGCAFQEPTGHMIMFDLLRRMGMDHYSDAEIAHLNALKPDLARSVFLASRLAFSEARAMATTLSSLGLAAVVLGAGMTVLAMNEEAAALAPRICAGPFDRLVLENKATTALIKTAFSALASSAKGAVQSFPMTSSDGLEPLILHLLPVRRSAHDVFGRGLALLIVTTPGKKTAPDMRVLSGLFDLTPAEGKAARELARGKSLEEIATLHNVTVETVRTHVKSIFAKTGSNRQPELVALLLGLSAP
ncbi:DNA-binding CsgD family transcriptional regulator [Rhizobium sp. SG_E_25_P2]|uniref:helix-turn-helix transcriptional regulator n=1 Tax=Rhizobium sp. SG_E_25_P2 TaxID=2879942 RepID=UPI00247473D8|nr:helix-turn-helix transcriptional regulator [Rhizobium sp. SG_E_25_P2]MDH6268488.1 DNA-binding CsgD family transcriptional regulator [Rhizobium sp. SG_E_25_P2]